MDKLGTFSTLSQVLNDIIDIFTKFKRFWKDSTAFDRFWQILIGFNKFD